MESISQMLNVDNSIFFDVNTQVFNEVPNNNSHKRRSDDRLSKLDHKKAKIHSENARHKTDSAILPKQNIRNEKIKQEKVLETHKANNSIFSDSICSEDLIRVCEETDKYMKVEPHSSNEIKIEKSSSPLLKPTKSFKKPKVNVSGYLTKLKRKQSQTFKTEPSSSSSQNKPPLSQSVLNEIKELDNLNFSSDVSQNYNSSFNWSQSTVIFNENENIEIKHNPVTGSQYIQEKSESLDDSNVTKRQQFYASRNPIKELEIINEGEFFGLGKKFKKHLQTVKRITNLYDWQEECLKLDAIDKRRNLVYALPTSGGKTLVSEILMLREVLLRKKNVIFILPYVSIVQEKINDLLPFACEYDFFVEEYCSGKGKLPPIKRRKKNSIYVCTIEKANILIDSLIELERLDEISLIVVDELHMIGDSYRGYVLELLLTKIIYFDKIPIQIVGMSATIANLQDVANFLFADIYTRNFRPIELQEYVKVDGDLYMVDYKATNANDAFKLIEPNVDKVLSEKTEKRDPSMITPCIYECVKEEGSCLIFCSTKKNCENVALLLVDCLPKTVLETKKQERIQLINAMKMDSNGKICPVLARSIPCGIAYHNSSLTNDERRHIEEAFRAGVLNVICCTSTLAAGVNLPAKRVVIRSPYVGSSFLTLSKYKQMIGRAGRAGIVETGESFLLCTQKDYLNVVKMLTSTMDFTLSGFLERKSIIRTCVLNLIVVKICKTIKELLKFSSCLLAHIQRKQYDKDIEKMFIDVIKELMVENAILQKTNDPKCSETIHVFVGDKRIEVTFNDELEINKFGQAAMKAGMNLEEAKSIDKELRKAAQNLVVSQCLHLLYIVAPSEAYDSVKLDFKNYNEILMSLNQSMMRTANMIGITEQMAMKMVINQNFKEHQLAMLKRFYIALVLNDLWNGSDIYDVAKKYKIERGIVHKLMQLASTQAYVIFKFCEEFDEFWVFKEILEKFSQRLSYCCSLELLPLMNLPCVKLGRAKQMYNKGIRTICDVAGHSPEGLMKKLQNLNSKQACMIIRAAQHAVNEQIDDYRAQMYELAENARKLQD